MKTNGLRGMLTLFLLLSASLSIFGQDNRLEVPGDHFSLEGALELFKKSSSPEEFERLLNAPGEKVNNLDLNGDGQIDYIRVIDRNEGNVHAFILQAVISNTESQDVAVIELEKLANGRAVLQITGDADVYGTETIIEPTEEVRINAGSSTSRAVVNVWAWPSVQYVYGPYYSAWVSPWRWSYYPMWWRPWRPVAYYVYDPWWAPYRSYYSVCYTHRSYYAPRIYRPYRTTSVTVYHRHQTQLTNYRSSRRDQNGYSWERYRNNRPNDRQDYRNGVNDSRETRKYSSPKSGSSGSSGQDWRRQPRKEDVNRGASGNGNSNASKDRASADWRGKPLTLQRPDASRKWSGSGDQNNGSRQRITRPANERSGIQRSSGTQINRGSGGNNSNIQRSGNRGNGNKPVERKRGRE